MTAIIAEFCQNHKGDRSILKEMIHAAAESGATYAKIQSIWVKDLTKRDQFEEGATLSDGKVKVIKRPYQPEYERLRKLELSLADHLFFIEECVRVGLTPLTTIFAAGDTPHVARLPWPQSVVKVASYDCGSFPFLKKLASHFDTLFVSTGATHDHEIKKAVQLLDGKKIALFHCVTSYPNTLDNCHLARLQYLRKFSPEVGWSDHTLVDRDGLKAAKVALALGADYVERHFTVLPASETKDGPVSMTLVMLRELVDFSKRSRQDQMEEVKRTIPELDLILGQSKRDMTHVELLNRDYYRGRFATHIGGNPVYNWEESDLI